MPGGAGGQPRPVRRRPRSAGLRVRHLWLVGRESPPPARTDPPTLELPFPLPPLPVPWPTRVRPLLVELALVLAYTAAGTGVATAADALARPLDGRPALFLLLLLALPLWDLMPARPLARIGTAVSACCAVAALWYLFAMAWAEPWWRGEGAFGVACLVVGWTAVVTLRRLWLVPDAT